MALQHQILLLQCFVVKDRRNILNFLISQEKDCVYTRLGYSRLRTKQQLEGIMYILDIPENSSISINCLCMSETKKDKQSFLYKVKLAHIVNTQTDIFYY